MKANVAFLLLVIAGQIPKAAAQSPGTFTATGNMLTPRSWHTATLLPDGTVLIARGTGGAMTSQWADTASLLPHGKVLVTKGHTDADPSVSWAELYDPSTAAFTVTGGRG